MYEVVIYTQLNILFPICTINTSYTEYILTRFEHYQTLAKQIQSAIITRW